jgi:hypothetical protein
MTVVGGLVATPSLGGVVDTPIPAPFTQHVFTVPGLPNVAGLEAFISCTNLDAVSVTVGVELFDAVGGVGNDAAATSLTLMPGQTLAFGTGFALNFTVDSVIGGLISSKYSARVLSTSKKIGCNAFVMDVANAPPTSGWPLTIIAKTKQKAAN